jgi:hypothetical protein
MGKRKCCSIERPWLTKDVQEHIQLFLGPKDRSRFVCVVRGAKIVVRQIAFCAFKWPCIDKLRGCRNLQVQMHKGGYYRLGNLEDCVELMLMGPSKSALLMPVMDALPVNLERLTVSYGIDFPAYFFDKPVHVKVTHVRFEQPIAATDLRHFDGFPNLKHLQLNEVVLSEFSCVFLCCSGAERQAELFTKWQNQGVVVEFFTANQRRIFDWKTPHNNHNGPCHTMQTYLEMVCAHKRKPPPHIISHKHTAAM